MRSLDGQHESHVMLRGDAGQGQVWSIVLPLCVYFALMLLLVPKHEPWADEAQAWQLAHYASAPALLTTLLHLEMTPGLWHALLRIEAALGVTYAGMHWVTAAIGAGAVFLLLRRSPFPWWIRVCLPFTYFLAYQYPIVARSYSLAPLLLFLLASQWSRRGKDPIRIALLIALLANVSAHTLMISIGFSFVLAVETWQGRARKDVRRDRVLVAGIIVCAAICFAAWCCHPPADAPWVIAVHTWKDGEQRNTGSLVASPWQHRFALLGMVMKNRDKTLMDALLGGLAFPEWLALPVWFATVFLFLRQGRLRYLWPVAVLAAFGTFTRFSPYHQGLMWLLLLNLLWISWPAKPEVLRRVLEASLALCMVVQLLWSARVMHIEIYTQYAPSADAAPVLTSYLAGGREVDLAISPPPKTGTPPAFFSVGLQPYFATQPFANLSYRYWPWLGDPGARERYTAATSDRRAIAMVVEYPYLDKERVEAQRLLALGYHEAHRFCARSLYPNFYSDKTCYVFFEPPPASTALAPRP